MLWFDKEVRPIAGLLRDEVAAFAAAGVGDMGVLAVRLVANLRNRLRGASITAECGGT